MPRSLHGVYRAFATESYLIVAAFDVEIPDIPKSRLVKRIVNAGFGAAVAEACVVKMHDCWARFCRDVVLLSATGGTVTTSGRVLTPPRSGVKNISQALAFIASNWGRKPSFGEPRWGDQNECLKAAQILGVANYATISAAIGSTPSPADYLRLTRNYVAHRNHRTAAHLVTVATAVGCPHRAPSSILRWVQPGTGATFDSWQAQLDIIAQATVA